MSNKPLQSNCWQAPTQPVAWNTIQEPLAAWLPSGDSLKQVNETVILTPSKTGWVSETTKYFTGDEVYPVVPKAQSTLGREGDTENVAEALLPHSTNETKSIEEKDREDEWVAFVVPCFYFEERVGDYHFRKPVTGVITPNRTHLTPGCISEISLVEYS